MQLIEEEGDDIKSYLETQRRDDDALSKVTHERNSRGLGPYLSPLIVYKDSKSEYDGEVSEESYVLPRE